MEQPPYYTPVKAEQQYTFRPGYWQTTTHTRWPTLKKILHYMFKLSVIGHFLWLCYLYLFMNTHETSDIAYRAQEWFCARFMLNNINNMNNIDTNNLDSQPIYPPVNEDLL